MAIVESGDWSFIGSGNNWIAYTGTADRIDLAPMGSTNITKTNIVKIKDDEVVKWGKENQFPIELNNLVWSNHLKPQILKTLRDLAIGSGFLFYKRMVEGPKKWVEPFDFPEGYEELETLDARDILAKAMLSHYYCGAGYLGFTTDVNTGKVILLDHYDFTSVRLGKIPMGDRRPATLFLHPTWKTVKHEEVVKVPIYNPRLDQKDRTLAYIFNDGTPGNSYYDLPDWYGSQNWTLISNMISAWHISGLKNGYNLRYIIHIPSQYFDKYGDKAKEKEAEFKNNLDSFLAGVDNVGKSLLIKFAVDELGKPITGFKIDSVPAPEGEDMYLGLDQRANIAQVSAHGINPSLGGVDTGGKLFGSGSELRVAYQLHIAMRTGRVREIFMKFFNTVVKKRNRWPADVYLGIEDVNLTTIAENPNGVQKVQNQAL